MNRLQVTALLAALCLGSGLALSYGGEAASPTPTAPVTADASPTPAPPAAKDIWDDPLSGLTWRMTSPGQQMTWDEAKSFCAKMAVGGHNDWHMPTIDELRYLIRGCATTQTGGSCGVADSCRRFDCWKADSCKGCPAGLGPGPGGAYWSPELAGPIDWYWSSSQVARAGKPRAWLVAFSTGDIYSTDVSFGNCARVACVRKTGN